MVDDIYYQWAVTFTARLWPYLNKFNDFAYAWHSSGFDKFWEWKIAADYLDFNMQKRLQVSALTNLDNIGPVKLGMSNFAGLIVVWLAGITISVLGFAFEFIYFYYWQDRS